MTDRVPCDSNHQIRSQSLNHGKKLKVSDKGEVLLENKHEIIMIANKRYSLPRPWQA